MMTSTFVIARFLVMHGVLLAAGAPQETPGANTPPAPATPAAPASGPKVVSPPFLPNPGAQPTRAGPTSNSMPAPYFADAQQFLVQPGQTWKHILADVRPGDEIIFPAGLHVPQVIEDLQGSPDRPIFIRSRDRIPAAVACEGEGWVFIRPKHIVLENIMFLSPKNAAIVIDGKTPAADANKWQADFMLRNCTITGSRNQVTQDAVRIMNIADVRVDQVRVDGWQDAAVELQDARRILVRGIMMVPSPNLAQACGVKVLGESGEISITGCAFNKVTKIGVVVGSSPHEVPEEKIGPVSRIRIDRCIFENPGTAVEIVNARDLVLSRATIVNPTTAIYSIPDFAGVVDSVLIEKCLAFWFPGTLARFSPHPDRIPPTTVTLAGNLWYSLELPLAWEVLGAPFGFQSAAQLINIDPGLDNTTLAPRNADAVRYGAFSMAEPGPGRPALDPVQGREPPRAATPKGAPAKN